MSGICVMKLLQVILQPVAIGTPLLAAITNLIAPAQQVTHAALTAIGAGFGYMVLLQCIVAVTEKLPATVTGLLKSSVLNRVKIYRLALPFRADSLSIPLIAAGLLAMAGSAFYAKW